VRQTWKAVVEDASLIPRMFLMPDMGKIQEMVGRGIDVPGVRREQVSVVTVRGVRS
jgi:hypothetical protein